MWRLSRQSLPLVYRLSQSFPQTANGYRAGLCLPLQNQLKYYGIKWISTESTLSSPTAYSSSHAADHISPELPKSGIDEAKPRVRLPLPPGVPKDKFGLYELLDTGQDWKSMSGENAVVAVHGPEELWSMGDKKNEGAAGGVFAVVAAGGTQYKVMPGDVLYTNRRPGEVNEQVKLDEVLAVGAYDWTVFGRPLIRGAYVTATVEEQTLSGKVIVAKFKKRKGYRRRKGHRQPITRMRIEEVKFEFPDSDKITPFEVKYDPLRPPLPNHLKFF